MSKRGRKQKEELEKYRTCTPLFFAEKKAEPYRIPSLQSDIRKLFSILRIKKDFLQRNITPGSIRKSARLQARLSGMQENELDAIGNWAAKTTAAEHYDEFFIPPDLSDTILNVPQVLEAVGAGALVGPLFEAPDACEMAWRVRRLDEEDQLQLDVAVSQENRKGKEKEQEGSIIPVSSSADDQGSVLCILHGIFSNVSNYFH